jgi:hypothetical protein
MCWQLVLIMFPIDWVINMFPKFPRCSSTCSPSSQGVLQYVPQVPKVFLNMFPIAPHFIQYALPNIIFLEPMHENIMGTWEFFFPSSHHLTLHPKRKKDESLWVYVQSSHWLHAYSIPRHGCHHIFASGMTLLQTTLYLNYSEHDNKGSKVMCSKPREFCECTNPKTWVQSSGMTLVHLFHINSLGKIN